MIGRLRTIAEKEAVKADDNAFEAILESSEGDLRKAITTLQSASKLKMGGDEVITKKDVCDISGVIPEKWIKHLMEACQSNSFETLCKFVDEFICEGFSAIQLINQLLDVVVASDAFGEMQKSVICETLAVNESRLLDGANEYLQIMDTCSVLMTQMAAAA